MLGAQQLAAELRAAASPPRSRNERSVGGARLAEGGGPAWLTLETLFLCTLCKLWLCALESPMPAVGVARAAVASVLWSQLQGHPKPPCLPESPGQWLERLSHKHLNSAESQNQNRDKKGWNPAALPWLTPTATPTARARLPPAAPPHRLYGLRSCPDSFCF